MWQGQSKVHQPAGLLRCSFCAKSQNEVRKLIAGPKVYICDECIELCVDIFGEEWQEEQLPTTEEESEHSASAWDTGVGVCSLCGDKISMRLLVSIPTRGFLCFACLDAIRAVTEPGSSNGQ